MYFIEIMQIGAAATGIVTASIVLISRRFGAASWLLSCFLLFSAAVPGMLLSASDGSSQRDIPLCLAVTSLLVAAPFGLFFSWSVDRLDYRKALAQKRKLLGLILLPLPFLLAMFYWLRSDVDVANLPYGFIALGPGGYLASVYLLVISVMALAILEQTIRGVDEGVRWEIKFLVLGLAGAYATIIFVASKALLYSFRHALLPLDALYVFTFIFPLSCLLILLSWRRSSGRSVIRVSQSFVYSSITLLAVGIYLIASSLVARWVSQWGVPGIQTEAIVFLFLIITLGATLLTTQFRHRTRLWIRRNIFAGKYDYRRYWLEATEKVRWVDDPQKTAEALAQVVRNALGSIDVSVWLRDRNPNRLVLLSFLGAIGNPESTEVSGIVEKLVNRHDPLMAADLQDAEDSKELRTFLDRTNASILVPLVSSNRIVGILTVGSDRSGHPFDREAREFLGVLANHTASEFHKYELLAALVETREMEAFKSFSTFLLHDLKNFASTLSLIARNAERHQGNPDFQRDAFQSVFDTAEKMKRLCNNLRVFSSTLAADKTLQDLNEIVRMAVKDFESTAFRNLRKDLADLPRVLADAEEIRKVVQNLLLNAHQATPSTGTITIKTACNGGSVELSVTDDGEGMPPAFLEKELFLPFRTTKSDGLGIGLFQSKKIIEAHGGTISVESALGKGTTVQIKLPANLDNAQSDQK